MATGRGLMQNYLLSPVDQRWDAFVDDRIRLIDLVHDFRQVLRADRECLSGLKNDVL